MYSIKCTTIYFNDDHNECVITQNRVIIRHDKVQINDNNTDRHDKANIKKLSINSSQIQNS